MAWSKEDWEYAQSYVTDSSGNLANLPNSVWKRIQSQYTTKITPKQKKDFLNRLNIADLVYESDLTGVLCRKNVGSTYLPWIDGKEVELPYDEFHSLTGKFVQYNSTFWSDKNYFISWKSPVNAASYKIPIQAFLKYFDECPECGAVTDYFQEGVCFHCADKVQSMVREYSSKAEAHFNYKPTSEIHYGVELELEGRSLKSVLYAHRNLKDHCILKRDGSLENGFEIVTKPSSIEEHKKQFEPFFSGIKGVGLKAANTCGMHVHVSKKPLSALQIKRIAQFLENNIGEVHKIAGRKESYYAKITGLAQKVTLEYNAREPVYSKRLKASTSERYVGLNCSPTNTIEFRMFASTTDAKKFNSNLEFVKAIVGFTTPGYLALKITETPTWGQFKEYTKTMKNTYPNLFETMKGL